jgi:hypothetical protein
VLTPPPTPRSSRERSARHTRFLNAERVANPLSGCIGARCAGERLRPPEQDDQHRDECDRGESVEEHHTWVRFTAFRLALRSASRGATPLGHHPHQMEPFHRGRCTESVLLRLGCLVVVLVVASAGAAWSAAAKGPTGGSICGGLGCVALNAQAEISPFVAWWNTSFVHRDAPDSTPYYLIRLRDDYSAVTWTLLYVPAKEVMRIWQSRPGSSTAPGRPYWRSVPPSARGTIHLLVRQIVPYPTPQRWRR